MTDSPLDSPETYSSLDPSGLYDRIAALPDQVEEAWAAASRLDLPASYADVDRVAVLGMGGSGIGGSLLRALAIDVGSTIPVDVVRGYTLPAYIGPETLAIASSNSGNTEEIVALAEQAVAAGAQCVALTTGGRLAALATENDLPALKYAWSGEPRAALGWSFASLVAITRTLGLLPEDGIDIAAAARRMRALCDGIGRDVQASSNPAKQLAARIAGHLPVIIGADAMAPVAYRWRTQINENAKSWATAEELPEMNHNTPVGYGGPPALVPLLHVVMLRHASVHDRVAKRIDLTSEQLRAAGVSVEVLHVPGATVFEQMLWAIQFGDFASYYLGLLNGADPSEVRALDWLKSKMAAE